MPKILAPPPLNAARSMNTNRKNTHLLPIAVQTTRHTETYNIVENSVSSVINAVLVQRSVKEIRRNKSEITNFHSLTVHLDIITSFIYPIEWTIRLI